MPSLNRPTAQKRVARRRRKPHSSLARPVKDIGSPPLEWKKSLVNIAFAGRKPLSYMGRVRQNPRSPLGAGVFAHTREALRCRYSSLKRGVQSSLNTAFRLSQDFLLEYDKQATV